MHCTMSNIYILTIIQTVNGWYFILNEAIGTEKHLKVQAPQMPSSADASQSSSGMQGSEIDKMPYFIDEIYVSFRFIYL